MNLEWMERAACKGMAPTSHEQTDMFFDDEKPHAALMFCRSCPVVAECKAYGAGDGFGVWGGTTPKDRNPSARKPAECGTDSGYRRHRASREKPCEGCRLAHNAAFAEYSARAREFAATGAA